MHVVVYAILISVGVVLSNTPESGMWLHGYYSSRYNVYITQVGIMYFHELKVSENAAH